MLEVFRRWTKVCSWRENWNPPGVLQLLSSLYKFPLRALLMTPFLRSVRQGSYVACEVFCLSPRLPLAVWTGRIVVLARSPGMGPVAICCLKTEGHCHPFVVRDVFHSLVKFGGTWGGHEAPWTVDRDGEELQEGTTPKALLSLEPLESQSLHSHSPPPPTMEGMGDYSQLWEPSIRTSCCDLAWALPMKALNSKCFRKLVLSSR